ncbi:XrtA/PEP-CTERM system histidine kinase PrsK [Colwelliaceae bacterium 6471]
MHTFGFFSYIFASFSYFVFVLLLLAARNNTFAGRLVLFSSLLTFISFSVGAAQLNQLFSLKYVLVLETCKLPLWSLLLVATQERITSFNQVITNKKSKNYILLCLTFILASWIVALNVTDGIKYLFLLFLVLNLWVLVLIEQLYRNSDVKSKWALWPLIIGLGAISVFDFIMYAQAAMLNQLNFDLWYLRSFVAIIAVPFLLISTRRMKDWSVNVFISRDVVFYSSMLLISGVYLLLMAFSGYVLNYLGGEWGSMFNIAFLVLGGIVLAVLLVTEKFRREVKVFITKHFFANKYDYRVEWLKLIDQLENSESGNYYKTALDTISSTLHIEQGLLVKRLAYKQYTTLYQNGIELTADLAHELTLIDEYCTNHPWVIDVEEYQKVENSYPELFLDSILLNKLNIAIIVPIVVSNNIYGFFVLSQLEGNARLLNWEDRDLLSAIAMQLSHFLTLNEASDELSQAKQFDAFNQMSAFLVHDLKNIQAQLALININAKKHRDNPAFVDDVFETVASATERLDKMLAQLRNKQIIATTKKTVSVNALINKVVTQRNINVPKISFEPEQDVNLVIDQEKFSSVINHLLQNAQEATSAKGWVSIKTALTDDLLKIEIKDNGCGMSQQFVQERLFKPFDTTKGNAGMGIGVFEAKQYVESIGGNLDVLSVPDEGTTFELSIVLNG